MSTWHDALSDDDRDRLQDADVPDWTGPMLAVLTHDHFSDDAWIYERKLDGQRCLAFRDGDDVRLLSRNQKPLNDRFPRVADAVAALGPDRFVLDGELVAFEDGVSSFARLQPRIQGRDPEQARQSDVKVYFYVFDVLHLEGHDVTGLPQRTRKSVLRRTFAFDDPLRFTQHRNGEGEAYYAEACRKGWEGVIAKRADAPYTHSRSKDWLKFKCQAQQEFVIGGYTEPEGSRVGFGALLLGFYDGDDLHYAGKVGTGFDDALLEDLHGRMQQLERDTPPFADDADLPGNAHWVTPKLVGEVAFTEWTNDLRLRHPRFQGLRTDKDPKDVVKEG